MQNDHLELPHFRFHSDPIKTRMIKKENTICPVCKKHREYTYVGPFYSVEDVEGICPWCIDDGSAAKKYDGEFPDRYFKEIMDFLEMTTERFHELCDDARSPHLWKKLNGDWKLRHTVNHDGVDDLTCQ